MAVSGILLAMSYPLATGREWARRVLLVGVVLIGSGLVLWEAVTAIPFKSFSHLSPEQVEVVRVWTFLRDLSSFIVVLAVAVFGILFLSHRDVVTSFQRPFSASAKV